MAAVLFADGVKRNIGPVGEAQENIWISPSSMDSNDTVVLPTVNAATLRIVSCFDNTTGDSATASVSGFTVTIDTSGSTTDHVYVLKYIYEV